MPRMESIWALEFNRQSGRLCYLMQCPKCKSITVSTDDIDCSCDTPPTNKADGGDITASNTRIGGASDEPPKSPDSDFANSQDVGDNGADERGCP